MCICVYVHVCVVSEGMILCGVRLCMCKCVCLCVMSVCEISVRCVRVCGFMRSVLMCWCGVSRCVYGLCVISVYVVCGACFA